jgi:hypothetical protein
VARLAPDLTQRHVVGASRVVMSNSVHAAQQAEARAAPPLRHLRSSIGVPKVLRKIVIRRRDCARDRSGATREA